MVAFPALARDHFKDETMHYSGITGAELFSGLAGWTRAALDLGIDQLFVLNHWHTAIEVCKANYQGIRTFHTRIEHCKPKHTPRTTVLDASPTCVGYTNANGESMQDRLQLSMWEDRLAQWDKAFSHAQSRALIHQVPLFARYHRYPMIFMENVTDLGKDPQFRLLIQQMRNLKRGLRYQVRQFCLNAMHFGAACSRDRAFLVFAREGLKLPDLDVTPSAYCQDCAQMVTPWQDWGHRHFHEFHWGDYGLQYRYRCPQCRSEVFPPTRASREVLDLSLPMKPVANSRITSEKSKVAIAEGIRRFGGQPFIRTYNGNACFTTLDEPMPTLTTHERLALTIPQGPHVKDALHRFITPEEGREAMTFPPHHQLLGDKAARWTLVGNAVAVQNVRAIKEYYLPALLSA